MARSTESGAVNDLLALALLVGGVAAWYYLGCWGLVLVASGICILAVALAPEPNQRKTAQVRTALHNNRSRKQNSQREFYDALERLGFETYHDYLVSDIWERTKRRYRESNYLQQCLVCGDCNFVLHHITYERLGHEELLDLIPLCDCHHTRLHELLEEYDLCVKDSHEIVRELQREWAGDRR